METIDVPWVVACDGARSPTRDLLGLKLKGKADNDVFILGDVKIDWDRPEDEGNNILSSDGIVLIVPIPEPQRFRIIAHMPKLSTPDQAKVSLDLLQSLVDQRTPFPMRLSDLTWSSTFSSKHFVVSEHRLGRVFLASDAAHLHSPVGGQGLNSGIQDAYNLMWKLGLVQRGQALPELLDSYTMERHKTAQSLIARVGTATKIVTLRNPLAQKLRNQLAGVLININRVRNRMGRDVAMLDIEYKDSPAVAQNWSSKSIAGYGQGTFQRLFNHNRYAFHQGPSAGMRAPNVISLAEGAVPSASLFDIYRGAHYTLLLFSGITGSAAINTLLETGGRIQTRYQASIQPYTVTVDPPSNLYDNRHVLVDAGQSIHRSYAAWQPCLYLIRPDKYIAYRSQVIDKNHLTAYLDRFLVRNPVN